MHKDDLPTKFYKNWATNGQYQHGTGRFHSEIEKLKKIYKRCHKGESVSQRNLGSSTKNDADIDEKTFFKKIERRSGYQNGGQLRVAHNPAHRMMHIVGNVKKWSEHYLNGCKKQSKVEDRWKRFEGEWKKKMKKNSIFKKEFEEEERYLRNNDGPGRPCGRIFQEFGLHGQYMELRDASVDESNGYDDLRETDFGNDQIMSMVPFEGKKYIC